MRSENEIGLELLKKLVARTDLNVNFGMPNKVHWKWKRFMPLVDFVSRGAAESVKLLLRRDDLDLSMKNQFGDDLLAFSLNKMCGEADDSGYVKTVYALLDSKRIKGPDDIHRYASRNGLTNMLDKLLTNDNYKKDYSVSSGRERELHEEAREAKEAKDFWKNFSEEKSISSQKDTMSRDECFHILGIQSDTPKELAKKHFIKLTVEFHPDKNKDKGAATKKLIEISNAWAQLKAFKGWT